VGAKYSPSAGLAVSAEIGFSPWAIDGRGCCVAGAKGGTAEVVPGSGSAVDVSFRIEWL
jgi:hypothetical protein